MQIKKIFPALKELIDGRDGKRQINSKEEIRPQEETPPVVTATLGPGHWASKDFTSE